MTFDTVMDDTPASAATCAIVTLGAGMTIVRVGPDLRSTVPLASPRFVLGGRLIRPRAA
jgi:hypothetical protein